MGKILKLFGLKNFFYNIKNTYEINLFMRKDANYDEKIIQKFLISKLNNTFSNIIIKKFPKSSNLFRSRPRRLDILLKEKNFEILLELKIIKKNKQWGWDEAIIQTQMDAADFPDRIRVIVIFDKINESSLSPKEKKFLQQLKKLKIYYFRYYKINNKIEIEENFK